MLTPKDPDASDVLKKLINGDASKRWYTITELSAKTGLPESRVREAITSDSAFVRSSRLSEDNQALFSTRADYEDNESFGNRLWSSFKNRID